MRILPVIVLFSTIFLQTNLVYGGDGDNSVLDDIEITVKLAYTIPNRSEVYYYSFVVVTDATKLLQQNSKYEEEMFYIKVLFAVNFDGTSEQIKKEYIYEINPGSVSNQSALKQLALDIQNQIQREHKAKYIINVKPKHILETPKITAENSFETGNFEEYTIRAVIDFVLRSSGKLITLESEITTNSSTPMDTIKMEMRKDLKEKNKKIMLEYNELDTSYYSYSLFVTGVDLKESYVDIQKKMETIRRLINEVFFFNM